ncbi:putative teichuronic acid biosynthesis glycosyltransferase TuaC [compost metagenome]
MLPSIRTQTAIPEEEGIPVALMEAMAAGVPVISTPTGGTAELLGEGAGMLVPPEDAPAIAEAIARLLRDPEARRAQVQRGREKVASQFSIQASVDTLSALFDTASREERHGP